MAVYKQPKSKNWSYKFVWNGIQIRKSTKQTNKRVAEQMEAAHRTSLARGEVGIHERRVPSLSKFADERFLPFVRSTKAEKPRTITFYETTVANLKSFPKLANLPLDSITSESLAEFVAFRQEAKMKVSTINRELATVRRIFNLAQEWGIVRKRLPRVKLNPGENSRMRVLTFEEETKYLAAAAQLALLQQKAYQRALSGIRAKVRGEQPLKPDAHLLVHVAVVLLDCGLRPDECYRLKWTDVRDGDLIIHQGKGKGSRRRVPCTSRVMQVFEARRGLSDSEWVFPRATKTGHIEAATLKKQHRAALKSSGVPAFVIYDFRHTRITRWAKALPLPIVQRIAGHTDIATTMRYVHLNDDDVRAAMLKEDEARGGHIFGHTHEIENNSTSELSNNSL